jgi:hypothetical protein
VKLPNLCCGEFTGTAGLFLSFRTVGRVLHLAFAGHEENGYGSEVEQPYSYVHEAEHGVLAPRVGPLHFGSGVALQHTPDISDAWNRREIGFFRGLSKPVILWFFSIGTGLQAVESRWTYLSYMSAELGPLERVLTFYLVGLPRGHFADVSFKELQQNLRKLRSMLSGKKTHGNVPQQCKKLARHVNIAAAPTVSVISIQSRYSEKR